MVLEEAEVAVALARQSADAVCDERPHEVKPRDGLRLTA
jgi:hypothetical protein